MSTITEQILESINTHTSYGSVHDIVHDYDVKEQDVIEELTRLKLAGIVTWGGHTYDSIGITAVGIKTYPWVHG